MVLKVGTVDLIPYVARGGLKWTRNDVDGSNTGRSLSTGDLIRDRLSIKYRLDVTCRPLTLAEASIVLQAVKPEWVSVTYTDPEAGTTVTRTMYSNNIPATFALQRRNGEEMWTGITFPLIQQ